MISIKNTLLILAVVLFAVPQVSSAETVLRSGSEITVAADQVVEGDYYVSSGPTGQTVMSGIVDGDMYAFGAAVTVNGSVGADAVLAAGTIDVHAPIGDDLRAAAGEIIIGEEVTGDVFVFARNVNILSSASVGGDIFVFGGMVTIEGDVAGSVYGRVEHLTLNSKVGGDIHITAPLGVSLGNDAIIGGNVHYDSATAINRSPASIVEGDITRADVATQTTKERAQAVLVPLFVLLFSVLSLYLLFKRQITTLMQNLQQESGKGLLVGAAFVLVVPITALVLMATVLGLFVGVSLLGILLVFTAVSLSLTGAVFGLFVARVFDRNAGVNLLTIVLGTTAAYFLLFVPILGVFIYLVICIMVLGGIALQVYRALA